MLPILPLLILVSYGTDLVTILLTFVLALLGILALSSVIIIVTIAMDWSWYRNAEKAEKIKKENDKAKLRAFKEKEARDSFFEGRYSRGFDASSGALLHRGRAVVSTDKAFEYYKKFDELGDTQLFNAVEDL